MSDGEGLNQVSPEGEATEVEVRRIQWFLWLQWVLASAVGFAFLGGLVLDSGPPWLSGLGIVWMVLAQWLVLRTRLSRAGWWVLVTLVGLALGGFAAPAAVYIANEWFGLPAAGLGLLAAVILGAPLGLLQWLVLRRQVRRAFWWLPATVAALFIGVLVAFTLPAGLLPELQDSVVFALALALGGAAYGAVTGATLIVLLPRPVEARGRKASRSLAAVGGALAYMVVICLGWGMLAEPINGRHLLVQYQLGRRDFSGVSLEGAYLSGANLSEVNLHRADLGRANLQGADLSGAWLVAANLQGADLSGADLTRAWLPSADLSGAKLYKADLGGANLQGADLGGADLSEARLTEKTSLEGATLPDGTVHK